MSNNNVEILLQRLESILWDIHRDLVSEECLNGIKDYLDNIANIMRVQFRGESIPGPFFSPSKFVNKDELLNQQQLSRLNLIMSKCNAYEAILCKNALEWAELCNYHHNVTLGYESLYAPCISAIESRVHINMRKGYFEVGDNAFPLHKWPEGYGVHK